MKTEQRRADGPTPLDRLGGHAGAPMVVFAIANGVLWLSAGLWSVDALILVLLVVVLTIRRSTARHRVVA
ncbi:hypothetical protein [Actinophytocola sediminis]